MFFYVHCGVTLQNFHWMFNYELKLCHDLLAMVLTPRPDYFLHKNDIFAKKKFNSSKCNFKCIKSKEILQFCGNLFYQDKIPAKILLKSI